MSVSIKSLRSKLMEDNEWLRFRNVFKTAQEALNIGSTEYEVKSLHASRPARSLSAAKLSVAILQEATIGDLTARSRLTEIKLLVYRTEELLSTAIKQIRKYLASQYADEVKSLGGTNAVTRTAILDRLLSRPIEYLSSLSSLTEQIDLIIKDIDQSAFSLNRSKELLQMLLDRKEAEL